MSHIPRAFLGSCLIGLLCLALAALYGWQSIHALGPTLDVVWIVLVLAMLEVSLSFDNAVVNAAILADFDEVWRARFLTWGMAVSVLGARVLFPLAIVGFSAGLGPIDAVTLSLAEPARYEAIMHSAHASIAGFGGAFLIMVGMGFFLDEEKHTHWLGWVERRLKALGGLRAAELALPLILLAALAHGLPFDQAARFLIAGLTGLIAFTLMESLGTWLESRQTRRGLESRQLAGRGMAQAGLAGFLYLNLLDTSFSLDGVVGAFALSNNMVVIALGLTIGALFVRSLTLVLVEQGSLQSYLYLEHGAFWAITVLGVIMLLSTRIDIPDMLTGLIGAGFIAAALISSLVARRKG